MLLQMYILNWTKGQFVSVNPSSYPVTYKNL